MENSKSNLLEEIFNSTKEKVFVNLVSIERRKDMERTMPL